MSNDIEMSPVEQADMEMTHVRMLAANPTLREGEGARAAIAYLRRVLDNRPHLVDALLGNKQFHKFLGDYHDEILKLVEQETDGGKTN